MVVIPTLTMLINRHRQVMVTRRRRRTDQGVSVVIPTSGSMPLQAMIYRIAQRPVII